MINNTKMFDTWFNNFLNLKANLKKHLSEKILISNQV